MLMLLLLVVTSPQWRIVVVDSLNRDLTSIYKWCKLWSMNLNPTKTPSMIVSRSRALSLHPDLSIDGTVPSTSELPS